MSRKLASVTVPVGLAFLSAFATPVHAATPITSFGVSAIVQAGCSVSAPMFQGTFATALTNASSAVSVNCSNAAQYSVVVLTATSSEVIVPNASSAPLRSPMNYAFSADAGHNFKRNGMPETGLAVGEPAGAPLVASNAHSSEIFVAITY